MMALHTLLDKAYFISMLNNDINLMEILRPK